MKRFKNAFFAFCLMLSMTASLTISAFAADETEVITEVDVSGISDAVIGETATVEGISIPEDANYELSSAEWSTDTSEDSFEGVFEDGNNYYLTLELVPDEGYRFDEYASVTIDSDAVNDYFRFEETMIIVVTYSFKDYIDTISVNGITDAVLGETASVEGISVPEDANYELSSAIWCGPSDDWNFIFENRNDYYLEITLEPKDGYAFDELLTVLVNGEEIENSSIDNWGDTLTIFLHYSFLEEIKSIELSGITDAVIGEAPVIEGISVPEDANYEIFDAEWTNYSTFEPFEVFENKNEYILTISLTAKQGYSFVEDILCTINGKNSDDFVYYSGGQVCTIYLTYSFLESISTIDFPAFPELTVGQEIEDYSFNVTMEDVNYEITGVWSYLTEEGEFEYFSGTVEEGTTYLFQWGAFPSAGYEFTEDATFTVDGNAYESVYFMNMGFAALLSKTYNFGDTEEIKTLELTVPQPVAGAEAKADVVTIPENSNYAIEASCWMVTPDGSLENIEEFEGNFAVGNHYMIQVSVIANDGSIFANDFAININGKTISANELKSTLFTPQGGLFLYSFGELEEVKILEETETPEETTTEEVTTNTETYKPEETQSTEQETTVKTPVPETGDNSAFITVMVMMLLAAGGVYITALKKQTN